MSSAAIRERVIGLLMGVPVSVKVMGIVLGTVVLVGAGMLWRIHETWHAALRAELRSRARVLADNLATQCADDVAANRIVDLGRRLDEARRLTEGVDYVLILDRARQVMAHTPPATPSTELVRANDLGPGLAPQHVVLEASGERIHDSAAPIPGGHGAVLRVGIGEGHISEEVGWLTGQLGVVTLVIATFALAAAWGLTRILARPVHDLVSGANRVRGGSLDVSVPVYARDEIGELTRAFNEMTAALREKEFQRQVLLRQVMAAGEEERKRLARDLHDETGQALTSLIAGLGALEASGTPAIRDRLAGLRSLAERTLGGVQDVSRALRPLALDDLGLEAALRLQCDTMGARFGASMELESVGWTSVPNVSPAVEIALYRIVQESLTNAVRHGRPRSVHVLLQRMASRVLIVIEDDGEGFDATDWRKTGRERGHMGLLGIEERAALLGGTLRVESSPGAGTSLFIEVPLRVEPDDEQDTRAHRG